MCPGRGLEGLLGSGTSSFGSKECKRSSVSVHDQ